MNNMKLKSHTLAEVLTELTHLYGHGAKNLCVICNDEESLNGDADPLIDGKNVTEIHCQIDEKEDGTLIPLLHFKFYEDEPPMKLYDIVFYLEKLPIKRNTKVALWFEGDGINYEYDCKVLDEDNIWNVTVK